MSVTIHLPAILRRHAGGVATLSASGGTVAAVLADLDKTHPELGRRIRDAAAPPNAFVTIYLNDEDVRFQGGLDAPVGPSDEIAIVSAIAGG